MEVTWLVTYKHTLEWGESLKELKVIMLGKLTGDEMEMLIEDLNEAQERIRGVVMLLSKWWRRSALSTPSEDIQGKYSTAHPLEKFTKRRSGPPTQGTRKSERVGK